MKLLAVGGQSRGVGKTAVTAAIIAATRQLHWTAVKITQDDHRVGARKGPYSLTRETDSQNGSDTARYLAAGAAEAYWLRTQYGQLAAALPAFDRLVDGRGHVIVESNSILDHRQPDLYLPVLDFRNPDCKKSCRTHLPRASAYVVVNPGGGPPPWPGVDPELFQTKPAFLVEPPTYFHPAIAEFVASRICQF